MNVRRGAAAPKKEGTKPRDFTEYLAQCRDSVYKTICGYLPMPSPEELQRGRTDLASTAMHRKISREYVDRRGKYLRPCLLMLSGQMFGAEMRDTMLPAAAMQLSEDFLLMKDDWEDASTKRRDAPAAYLIYGPKKTINASVACHVAMERILTDYQNMHPSTGYQLHTHFLEMLQDTLEGVFMELNFVEGFRSMGDASEALYLTTLRAKTCNYSVYGPLQLGAIAAGNGTPEMLRILKEIGTEAGFAFQIMDDILDMTAGLKSGFGKPEFQDIYEGKPTLMIQHAFELATSEEKTRIDEIYGHRRAGISGNGAELENKDVMFIRNIIKKYRGVEHARKVCDEHGRKAEELLESHRADLPSNEFNDMLRTAFRLLYVRNK